ncbi:sphingosine-1-phosphate lyase [Lepeophtheirus salmonis]|uniref:sphingosine-1-phosphate lyase n=1 Tax=Lepeophtheirus salmonis TaxID=72036 RepID=UPI001AE10DD7|nr:sphingosine-1-phosphate lyase-like [Lepeophtheirus salmonis]
MDLLNIHSLKELKNIMDTPIDLGKHKPLVLIGGFIGSTVVCTMIYNHFKQNVPLQRRIKEYVFKVFRKVPIVKRKVEEERIKTLENFKEEFLKMTSDIQEFPSLPTKGLKKDEVMALSKMCLKTGEFKWEDGKQSGTVYNGDEELTKLISNVYQLYAWSNPLHPDTFPGVRKMEAEIVRMTCNLFNGNRDSVGCVTSGGTESIILAVKAYRDYGRNVLGIDKPVIVVPQTAHAAFDKAAEILDIHIRHVKVDPITKRVNMRAMKSAICSRTVLLVGSAPQFPHGSMDPIPDIAALGIRYGIPVHVDACLGGFLICFAKEAGFSLPYDFDFCVEGVTSISADTHKYGYAPKGTSVLLYSKHEYRSHQWFTVTDWPGGVYATACIGGSRSGAVIAACWASLMYYGMDGYVEATRKIMETTKYIVNGLKNINGIEIVGEPDVSVVAFDSPIFNIYHVFDGLKKKGWNLNALQFPSCIHLCVTLLTTQPGKADEFVNDIEELAQELIANPRPDEGGSAALYGMAQSIPDRKVIDVICQAYLDSIYVTKDPA